MGGVRERSKRERSKRGEPMTDILAFALAAEVVTLFYWWLRGGLNDLTELISLVQKAMRGDK